MAFEPEKDKELKRWVCEGTGLVVTINQYADSQPKIQIGPRVFMRKDGNTSARKAGRLSMEDILWLYDMIDEIKDELARRVKPA